MAGFFTPKSDMKLPPTGLGLKWPPDRDGANRAGLSRGAALGDGFARISGGTGGMNHDTYERAIEAKKRAQARERERYGLKPAPYVAEGCEGEPKPPE